MSKAEKAKRILKEIEAIERIIKPYQFSTTEVSRALEALAAFKESLKDPEKADLSQVLEWLRKGESKAAYYRGYGPAEEALGHLEKMKKIISET